MNSISKSVLHTVASYVAIWLPSVIPFSHTLQLSLGAVLLLGANWVISHTIATTTGASAHQH